MTRIPPGERRELRSVVRSQFKVLRAEVEQRQAELEAEAEQQLVNRYRDEDKQMEDLNWRVSQVVDQASNDIEDLMKEFGWGQDGGQWAGMYRLSPPRFRRKSEDRKQLHAALLAGIKAQVKQASLALDRQEADLLRQLSLDALETDAAQAFLERIPTVASSCRAGGSGRSRPRSMRARAARLDRNRDSNRDRGHQRTTAASSARDQR